MELSRQGNSGQDHDSVEASPFEGTAVMDDESGKSIARATPELHESDRGCESFALRKGVRG